MIQSIPNIASPRDNQQAPPPPQSIKAGSKANINDEQPHPIKVNKKISKVSSENKKGFELVQYYLEKGLDNNITQISMGIVTIYALFGDDIRVLSTDTYGDPAFWSLNAFCLGAFTLEIIITCIAKKGYFNSFFFYLDIISTVSLILDIGWISNSIFSQGSSKASNAASLAKAGRASRVGTKAGRIVRIVRLIRLVKLYKLAQQRLQQEAEKLSQMEQDQNHHNNEEDQNHEQLANNTVMQKKVNNIIMKDRFTKSMKLKKQHTGNSIKKDLDIENQVKEHKENTVLPITPEEEKQKDDKSLEDAKQAKSSKLPPIGGNNAQVHPLPENLQQTNVPSKPVVLEKYKDDPLLQATHLNSEHNDMIDRKDPKKMAKDIIQINNEVPQNKKIVKQNTSQKQDQEKKQKHEVSGDGESKVGQKLSDLTTQRVIIIVLCIMISIPIFDASTYTESPTSYDNGLFLIYANFNAGNQVLGKATMKKYLDFHNDQRNPILYMENKYLDTNSCCELYPNSVFNDKRDAQESLRNDDKYYHTYSVDGELIGFSITDIRGDNELNAILSIIRTIFVSVVLSTGAILFSSDVETLVLTPIENMMKKVRRIAENPLEAAQIEEREALAMEQLAKDGNVKELQKMKEQEGYETVVLEKLIIKIGALLALGFGEAGSEIIAANMSKGGEVDPMIPGKKIMAIFGFCDIRNFTDATEVLQTGVMLFVNEIAEITHSTVDAYLGQSNKNIGDAFLLVWKYNEDDYFYNNEKLLELKDTSRVHNLADLPVLAFLKIMSAITISKKLFRYRSHKGLNDRLKNYRVKMGFGLHVGWAIEGAIGSGFKIDASYLSPNVNMASRLEAATKQFGTGLLISGPLYQILTDKCKKHLRHIDRVTVKGSILPLDLYTVDVHLDNITDKKAGRDLFDNAHLSLAIKKKRRVIDRLKRNKFREGVIAGKEFPCDQFEKDKELVAMREFFIPEFYEEWKVGFDHYLAGRWPQAKAVFQKTLVMLKSNGITDGPSNTLLEVIEENGGKAPSDWQGYRALTEK